MNPLYIVLKRRERYLNHDSINVSNIELTFIQDRCFIEGQLKNMTYNAFTFHGNGHGGGMKFMKLSEMCFDPLLNCSIGQWYEAKTLMKYAMMVWVHSKYKKGEKTYLTDIYFCLFLQFT